MTDDQGPFALHKQKFRVRRARARRLPSSWTASAATAPPVTSRPRSPTSVSTTPASRRPTTTTRARRRRVRRAVDPGPGDAQRRPRGLSCPRRRRIRSRRSRSARSSTRRSPASPTSGVWNVLQNADLARPESREAGWTALVRLRRPVRRPAAGVRGPTASRRPSRSSRRRASRDLGHSNPYFHTGKVDTLEDVVRTYIRTSRLEQSGALRNGAVQLRDMHIDESDVAPLAAFPTVAERGLRVGAARRAAIGGTRAPTHGRRGRTARGRRGLPKATPIQSASRRRRALLRGRRPPSRRSP